MKNLLLGIIAISLTFISFNLALRSVEPVHAAPPLAPPVKDIVTMLRPPRVIIRPPPKPERDEGGYSDYDHMKCLEQAQLEPRGEKRNDARKNCNQSLQ
jgi:hypothetical protein